MCFYNKKCSWCGKRKPDIVKFKGYHKYMNMYICQEFLIKNRPECS